MARSLLKGVASIQVEIGGIAQAKQHLKNLNDEAVKFRSSLGDAQKALESEAAKKGTADFNQKSYNKAKREYSSLEKQLASVNRSIEDTTLKIKIVEGQLDNLSGNTMRKLIETQNILKATLIDLDSTNNFKEFKTIQDFIEEIGGAIKRLNGSSKEYTDYMRELDNVSDTTLSMIRKRLEDLVAGTDKNVQELDLYRKQLKEVAAEEERRKSSEAGAVMGNLGGSTYEEIQKAIKATEELRNAQKVGSQEWEIYNEEIERAKTYLADYEKLEKEVAMDDRMKNLGSLSADALTETKKFWQEQYNGAEQGSQALKVYQGRLEEIAAEEENRKHNRAMGVMNNLGGSSVKEINDAIKATEELRNAHTRGSHNWAYYNDQIKAANKYLKEYDERTERNSAYQKMTQLNQLSASSLEEVKKYWQAQVEGAEYASTELDKYKKELQTVIEEENRRTREAGSKTLGEVQSGTFEGTIAQTKEAIKQLEEYKKQLKTSDTDGIKAVDEAIAQLNERIKATAEDYYTLQRAQEAAIDVQNGTFKGTAEDLERVKKKLLEYRQELVNNPNKKGFEENRKQIIAVEKQIEKLKGGVIDLDAVLKNPRGASFEELKTAAAALQKELEKSAHNTRDFIQKSAKLREVNAEIKSINNQWKEHDGTVKSVVKRLSAYVAVYGGFNMVVDKVQQMIQGNLELSDSLGDIQKTTGLTSEAVAELSREIDKIDSREATEALHSLAYEAGRLGIHAEEDVLGFVRAGNQIKTALGEDLGDEAIPTLMKINDLLGITASLGVEKALLSTGASLNELTAKTVAAAGPITDITARIAAVGSQGRLTMADMQALGATADALALHAESAGTALSKMLGSIQTNTRAIERAIDVQDGSLSNLMEQGKGIEAVMLVLERIGQMGSTGRKGMMKILGSDGERMNTVINSMANNVDKLRANVSLSNKAFEDATSITNEYNIKNETAMALLQRIGNSIRENFVNSTFVEGIRQFLQTLMLLPTWLERNYNWIVSMTSAVTGLTAALYANRLAWVATLNAMTPKQVWAQLILYIKQIPVYLAALRSAFIAAGGAVGLFKKGVDALKVALSKNWFTAAIGLVVSLGTAWVMFANRVTAAAKAQTDFNTELSKEEAISQALFNRAKDENTSKEKKTELINEINQRYGKYLGFMLSEKDSAEKISSAYELVNAKLRERIALKTRATLEDNYQQQYAGETKEAFEGMAKYFEENKGITEAKTGEAIAIVSRVVTDNLKLSIDEILAMVEKELKATYNFGKNAYGSLAYSQAENDIKRFIEARKEIEKNLNNVSKFTDAQMETYKQESITANRNFLIQLDADYKNAQKKASKETNKELLKEHNQTMLDIAKRYVATATDQLRKVSGTETDALKKDLEAYKKVVEELSPKDSDTTTTTTVWGREQDDVKALIAEYKRLKEERNSLKSDADYSKVYNGIYKNRTEASNAFLQEMRRIEKQLANKFGVDIHGNLLKGRKGRDKYTFGGIERTKTEIESEATAALSALEAYYKREEGIINNAYLREEITEATRQARLLRNEQEFLEQRKQLRRKLLGMDNDFDQTKFVGKDPQSGEGIDYFKGKNLDQLSGFIQLIGQSMTDGMMNQLAEDEVKIQQIMVEHLQKVQKIILDNDFTGQVDAQYQESLETLQMFFAKHEKINQEAAVRRLAEMSKLAADSYTLDAESLRDRMEKNEEFGEWIKDRSAEDYEALLIMLRKYHDDTEEAENRHKQRQKRIADREWEDSGKERSWREQGQRDERNAELMKNLGNIGLASESMVEDTEVIMYRNRLAAAQEYYDTLEAKGADLTQAESKRIEAMKDLENAEMQIVQRKMDTLKGYTDAVVDFSAQMGEAAFGEVEDRKAAAKQLLQTTLNLTKELIMAKVKELLMEESLNKQKTAMNQAQAATELAIKGQTEITSAGVDAAVATKDVATGITSGASKAIAKLGPWGIPLIAVISAALNALLGMAMGAVNKTKSEVASLTGASNKGRIAAGMLTYAEGDYPVLGNDGQIYNARYQKELKTGVYRGGAHFGIFSEKKPEMIVDGDTTQKLIVNYPAIYDAILTIAKNGRLRTVAPMQTYATGNLADLPSSVSASMQNSTTSGMNTAEMQATLVSLTAATNALIARLNQPINAEVNPYGKNGAVNRLNASESWMKKRGLAK